jgi:hypothetical protein
MDIEQARVESQALLEDGRMFGVARELFDPSDGRRMGVEMRYVAQRMKGAMSSLLLGFLALSIAACLTSPATADQSLSEKSQNPIGDLISVPFQNNTNFGVGTLDKTQNVMLFQPVAPISLDPDWNLIVRPITPFTYQPPLFPGDSYDFGIGDIQLQTYFVPKKTVPVPGGAITWGVGPVLQAKTATDPRLGTGKWSAGAGGVVFFAIKPFTFGALLNNIWSFAGDSDRANVNSMTLQPFINYNMKDGWYLVSSPVMTANWEATSGNRFTIPLGGGFGRVFNIGKQPINAFVQAFGYADKPAGGPDWTLRAQWNFLFPIN